MRSRERWGLYEPGTHHDACGVGFVAHIKGKKSRDIVDQALEILLRLSHRAACGADPKTGDGAGILLQIPHRFFKSAGVELGFEMPRRRRYGVGQIFMPTDPYARADCVSIVEEAIFEEGQQLIGWRDVPSDPSHLGQVARDVLPDFKQVFVARRRLPPSAFERKLYVIRKLAENRVRERGADPEGRFHIVSLSSETIVYKGLLLPYQLPLFYDDLRHPDMVTAIAVVHSRFSTNTFPTWDLAQPFRFVAHNGEINTLRGNRNLMNARRSQLQSGKFGGPLDRLFPIIVPEGSDSAQFDNMLELIHLGGRSLPHSIMMMIPEAYESNPNMDPERQSYYRYTESLIEPWDGPAAMVFTDGIIVGATLDRNGLRPARYMVTEDDRVILASETGVLDIPPEQVREKGRLRPGRILVVDTDEGRIIDDDEVKGDITRRFPYARWLAKNTYNVDMDPRDYHGYNIPPFPDAEPFPPMIGEELLRQQLAFGYTEEDLRLLVAHMAEHGKEPIGSMGSDTPLAVLSDQAPTLCNYFHQLFAQVTNPPIDPIRESLVMTVDTAIGPEGNTFEETPEQCHRLVIEGPILTNEKLAKVAAIREGAFEPTRLSMLYNLDGGPGALADAVERITSEAHEAIDEGYNLLILSDRGVDARRGAIPALLAVSAVHHRLVRAGTRLQAGLVIETAEACEVHDFAALLGYGVAAVNPYLALDTVRMLADEGWIEADASTAIVNYGAAVDGGLLKVMSKMGISSIHSYGGAQIFEAVGLDPDLVEEHFTGTPSRIGGLDLDDLDREVRERHVRGFGADSSSASLLPVGGRYRWRREGELHKWNPATIAALQGAVRQNDGDLFQEYSRLVDDEDTALSTLRGQLDFVTDGVEGVPVDEVEPASEIVKRFVTGAMSFGSVSAEAHETLAIAMNRLGGRSNSGEGGEEEHRDTPDENGDSRRSAIRQVASGRFGVTPSYLVGAEDLQIKVAQGAKPGEGGQLLGHKVDERIARVRHSTPGVTLISPPPHHDIYSIEDLAQLIYDLQTVNPTCRVSVKLVSEVGVGTVAAGVAKAHAGAVVISGYSGGTGASPLSSIKHAGLPWELGLAETQQVLVENRLRGRIRLQTDGGLRTGRDVAVAVLLGAEEFGLATAALVGLGCMMLRKCHLGACSAGIATQDPELREAFHGEPEHVEHLFTFVAEELRAIMARLGFRSVDEMVGRVEMLKVRERRSHWKAEKLDLSRMLAPPRAPEDWPRRFVSADPWSLEDHLDHQIVARAKRVLAGRGRISLELPVSNSNRAVGALLSGEIARKHGPRGLPEGSIRVKLEGSAGQSLGAFLAPGVTLELTGDANDYVGKGLGGGRVVVKPHPRSRFEAHENIIIGNTVLYGATGGELFAAGLAGERFAVRNSGARAVVEGVGDHGCEYMTGGVVVVLGECGRNFGAGMSGGTAFVFDRFHTFRERCNRDMVELDSLMDESDIWLVHGLIHDHVHHTGSALGTRILDNWEHTVIHFVRVMPTEYKRVLLARRAALNARPVGPPGSAPRGGRS
jgi:glutamate synthase (NADPH) large chain